jgi:hypothetical protein
MQAGAYEKVIATKLLSSLKRHLSEDSSRDSPFLRGVSAAESSGALQAVTVIELVLTSATYTYI